ncbi:MAG: DUF4262 domain-containing protein [Opitutaceae bacterium]|nr:DUF4262 domain-containing protein [Opitutaceae bacterium]
MPLKNFNLRAPEDASDRKLLADIAEYGWHVVHITTNTDDPGYSFTVGLFYSFGHPELVIMGLSQEVSHGILSAAVAEIRHGACYQSGATADRLIESFSCTFSTIPVEQYKGYLGYAIWFYHSLPRPFPSLQVIWPDKSGHFPGDADYDRRYEALQKVIR